MGDADSRARIAYLVKRFPRLSETFVLGEFLELRRQGADAVIYALSDPQEHVTHAAAAALVGEVTYLHDPRSPVRSWCRLVGGAAVQAVTHPRRALRLLWEVAVVLRCRAGIRHGIEGLWLARDLRRRRIAHVHAHFAHSPAAVARLGFLAGGPAYSFTAHAKDLYTTPVRSLRDRAAMARFVVTCTEFNGAHLRGLLGSATSPIHVIHHGVDLSRFTPGARQPIVGQVLTVGRLVPKKGHDDLLTAVAALHQRGMPVRWEVYGSGPVRGALEARVDCLGLTRFVVFHGACPQHEILRAYRSAALFALAPIVLEDGDRDGIPNVLVESMACGIPVVATRVSGIPELVHDGINGILVEPRNPSALADAVACLLSDPAMTAAFGRAARRAVEERFDVRSNTAALHRLFWSAHDEAVDEQASRVA